MVKLYFRKKGKRENDILIEKNLRIAGNIFVFFFLLFFPRKSTGQWKEEWLKLEKGLVAYETQTLSVHTTLYGENQMKFIVFAE